ncbi:MAG: hypothetical protein IKH30_03645 [Clostridia bacterium]|nr:hypothetical protein [Clostridia bacterium]
MKCPNCGQWNRASFPNCFKCGAELPLQTAEEEKKNVPKMPDGGAAKVYIQIDEIGRSTSSEDSRDKLAREMKDLSARKRRGEEEQRRLRENSVRQGFVPSPRIARTLNGRESFPVPQNTSYTRDGVEVEGIVRPDAIPVSSSRVIGYDEAAFPEPGMGSIDSFKRKRRKSKIKPYKRSFLRRFGKAIAAVLIVAALGFLFYDKLYKPYRARQIAESLSANTIITTSILNERAAHIIRIPGEDGQSYWITELKKSFSVTGGYATIEVEDYKWYEHMKNITEETVMATMSPYLRTSAGEQKQMQQITFEVEVPESTLELVSPSSANATTYRQLYEIQFRVERNSTVTINGEDFSDLVNNTDGLITFNAEVHPTGDNLFVITTRAQYCREKTETINIFRPKQDIRLDLAADIATRYSPNRVQDEKTGEWYEPHMTISGSTLTWATIEVRSPYLNLDTSELGTKGVFSFEAVFDKIGYNTITIVASAPGYEPSIVEHEVYYIPIADVYTRKAWSMKDQYTDYLNNSDRRIANTQIYQIDAVCKEILSSNPQMAVFELTDGSGRTVALTNYTYDNWVPGSTYRLFGDAYGVYNGAPWLNGRYSYIQKEKEEKENKD